MVILMYMYTDSNAKFVLSEENNPRNIKYLNTVPQSLPLKFVF